MNAERSDLLIVLVDDGLALVGKHLLAKLDRELISFMTPIFDELLAKLIVEELSFKICGAEKDFKIEHVIADLARIHHSSSPHISA